MNIRIECVRPVIGSAAFDNCITSHYIIRLTPIRAYQPALLIAKEYNLPSDKPQSCRQTSVFNNTY